MWPHAAGQVGRRGLTNIINSCYMNATLQCLFRVPAFSPADGGLRGAYDAICRKMAANQSPSRQELARMRDCFVSDTSQQVRSLCVRA